MSTEIPPNILAFLEAMKVPGVLATIGRDGGPVASAVWFMVDGGDVVVSTPAARPKARNARANPLVSFVVDTRERPYRGVAIEGVAVVEGDAGCTTMRRIAARYLGEPVPAWMEERISQTERVVIRIAARRVRPWGFE